MRFSIDYPVTTTTNIDQEIIPTNITGNNSQVKIDISKLSVIVKYKPYPAFTDPQELAVISHQIMINEKTPPSAPQTATSLRQKIKTRIHIRLIEEAR